MDRRVSWFHLLFFFFLSSIVPFPFSTPLSADPLLQDFDFLMNYNGNGVLPFFSKKERQDCDFYRKAYTSHLPWLREKLEPPSIPQIIHWVSLEEQPLSKRLIRNILSWKRFHPNWRLLFWTDENAPPEFLEGFEIHSIEEIDLGLLEAAYGQTGHFSEKADLLRYTLLEKMGGIAPDLEIRCFRSVETLRNAVDFFAFLKIPELIPGCDSSILIDHGLIGSAPHHPILSSTIQKTILNLKPAQRAPDFIRGINRTFRAFNSAVREGLNSEEYKNFVFPAAGINPSHLNPSDLPSAIAKELCWGFHTNETNWMKIPDFTTLQERFSDLYDEKVWGSSTHEFGSSGPGSKPEEARPFLDFLTTFLKTYPDIHRVVDLGCGDWELFADFDWQDKYYLGIDAVPSLIDRNQKKYGSATVHFQQADGIDSPLPEADLLICKDVLMHLSIGNIQKILQKISSYRYVILVNDIQNYTRTVETNAEIVDGDFRCLDLKTSPFSIQPTRSLQYRTNRSRKELLFLEFLSTKK